MSIPINLYTRHPVTGRSSSSRTTTRFINPITGTAAGAKYLGWSLAKPKTSSSSTTTSTSTSSSSTKTSTQLVKSTTAQPTAPVEVKRHKRKFTAVNVNDLDPALFITLTPNTTTIIQRCYPPPMVTVPVAPPVSGAGGSKKKGSGLSREIKVATTSRWSRGTDFGNSRSSVPSPQEVVREKIRAKMKAEAKVKAVAAKKTKKTPVSNAMARRRGSNNGNGNGAGSKAATNAAQSTDAAASATPPATTGPSSNFAPRTGLKRTRSTGLTPISSTIANALGTGAVSVSSPLKVVTGPDTPDEPAIPGRKRSRLSASDNSKKPKAGSIRKANSLSPTSNTIPIPGAGGSTSTANAQAGPGPSTVAAGRAKPMSTRGLEGGLEMRRVVSASNIGRKNGAAPEMARERSKREVTLPGRLRDYDIKAGGGIW